MGVRHIPPLQDIIRDHGKIDVFVRIILALIQFRVSRVQDRERHPEKIGMPLITHPGVMPRPSDHASIIAGIPGCNDISARGNPAVCIKADRSVQPDLHGESSLGEKWRRFLKSEWRCHIVRTADPVLGPPDIAGKHDFGDVGTRRIGGKNIILSRV